MKIKMLWGQRKCLYPGQYGVELLEAVDENCEDENPDYFQNEKEKYSSSGEFSSLVEIDGTISDVKLEKAMKNPIVDINI